MFIINYLQINLFIYNIRQHFCKKSSIKDIALKQFYY